MASAGLELFTTPPTDFRFEARREIKYQPVFPGVQPITFNIPASDNYIDLKEIKLEIKVHITDPAAGYQGTAVQGTRSASDAQLCQRQQFWTFHLSPNPFKFNGILMTEQTNLYHYLAYIQTLFNCSKTEGESKLVHQGWVNVLNVKPQLTSADDNDDIITAADATTNFDKLEELTKTVQAKRWQTFCHQTPHSSSADWWIFSRWCIDGIATVPQP